MAHTVLLCCLTVYMWHALFCSVVLLYTCGTHCSALLSHCVHVAHTVLLCCLTVYMWHALFCSVVLLCTCGTHCSALLSYVVLLCKLCGVLMFLIRQWPIMLTFALIRYASIASKILLLENVEHCGGEPELADTGISCH